MVQPLRQIVSRPTHTTETLECGHTILRPLGLGEFAMDPSKVQRRRCYKCEPVFTAAPAPRKRGAPAQQRGLCPTCGKTGLGNTYNASGRGAYRQCRYCGEPAFL